MQSNLNQPGSYGQQQFVGGQQQIPIHQQPGGTQSTGHPLILRIVEARGLKKSDIAGKCDPYCIIKFKKGLLQGMLSHEGKLMTRVVEKNTNPIWNEEFVLHPHRPDLDIIQIQVFDKDRIGADTFLGKVNLPVAQYWKRGLIDEWIPLQAKRKLNKLAFGELHLLVSYSDNVGLGGQQGGLGQQQQYGWNQGSSLGQQPSYSSTSGLGYGTGWSSSSGLSSGTSGLSSSGLGYGTGYGSGYGSGLSSSSGISSGYGTGYGSGLSSSSTGLGSGVSSGLTSGQNIGSRDYTGGQTGYSSSYGQPSSSHYGFGSSHQPMWATSSSSYFPSSSYSSGYPSSSSGIIGSNLGYPSSSSGVSGGGFQGTGSFVNYPAPVARHQDRW
jgi:hypothetical protein